VLDAELVQHLFSHWIAVEIDDRLRRPIAFTAKRNELECAVIAFARAVEYPCACINPRVLHDEIGEPLEHDRLAVEHRFHAQLVVDDVRLEERLQERAGIHRMITVNFFQRIERLDDLDVPLERLSIDGPM
jgi:hypothetical protein